MCVYVPTATPHCASINEMPKKSCGKRRSCFTLLPFLPHFRPAAEDPLPRELLESARILQLTREEGEYVTRDSPQCFEFVSPHNEVSPGWGPLATWCLS